MGLALKQASHAEIETRPNFHKHELDKRTSESLLRTFQYHHQRWEMNEFDASRRRILIGHSPELCDILLPESEADDVQAVIQLIDRQWYVIESGMHQLMLVNGFKKAQTILSTGQTAVIQFNDSSIILKPSNIHNLNRDKASPAPIKGVPQEGEFSLAFHGEEYRYPFQRATVIGSSPSADLRINSGGDFSALITSRGGRLHLAAMQSQDQLEIRVDKTPVSTEPVPLSPGSNISIANCEIRLKISRELRFSHGFKVLNSMPRKLSCSLRLIQLDSKGHAVKRHQLPQAGRSIFIGRSKEKADLCIPESANISRKHAQLILYEQSAVLLDCYSKNGSYINDEKISKRTVHPGDIIRLADTRFILCYDEH